MIKLLIHSFSIAWEAILQNKLRAMLTSLGIICGVASVIAMLAIGKGAETEILEKMKLLGTNNIIINPLDEKKMEELAKEEEQENGEEVKEKKNRFSPGLTMQDALSIKEIVPHVKDISPEIEMDVLALREGSKREIKLVGVNIPFFSIKNLKVEKGRLFSNYQEDYSKPVCVIGSGIKAKLFVSEDPIGKQIKCGDQWLTVIGILKDLSVSKDNIKNLGLRDYNYDVYIPVNTMLIRYINRSLITKEDLERRNVFYVNEEKPKNDQLDKLIVQVEDTKYIKSSAEIISRLIERRHNFKKDFEVIVPELLLEQEQRTKNIFNIVLGAIASISLLVGGIGIMNIMLASILERTKEIGVRLAVGAKQRDILMQFLSEAIAISLTGGFLGIFLGVAISYIIESSTEIKTVISYYSVLLSFFVSISVGLVFGIMPARKAAKQDPITSLRYE